MGGFVFRSLVLGCIILSAEGANNVGGSGGIFPRKILDIETLWDGISSDLSSNFIQYWGFCIRLFRNYRRHEVVAQLSIYDLRWHNLLGNYSEAVLIKQCSWTSSRSLILMTVVDGKYSWYKLLGQGKRDICGKIASKMFLKHFLGLLRPVSECNCGIIFVSIYMVIMFLTSLAAWSSLWHNCTHQWHSWTETPRQIHLFQDTALAQNLCKTCVHKQYEMDMETFAKTLRPGNLTELYLEV